MENIEIIDKIIERIRQKPDITLHDVSKEIGMNETDLCQYLSGKIGLSFAHLSKRIKLADAYNDWFRSEMPLTPTTEIHNIQRFRGKFMREYGIDPCEAKKKGIMIDNVLDDVTANSDIYMALKRLKAFRVLEDYSVISDEIEIVFHAGNMLDYLLSSNVYFIPAKMKEAITDNDKLIVMLISLRYFYLTGHRNVRIDDTVFGIEVDFLKDLQCHTPPQRIGNYYVYSVEIPDQWKDVFFVKIKLKKYRKRLVVWSPAIAKSLVQGIENIEIIKEKKYIRQVEAEVLWRLAKSGILRLMD